MPGKLFDAPEDEVAVDETTDQNTTDVVVPQADEVPEDEPTVTVRLKEDGAAPEGGFLGIPGYEVELTSGTVPVPAWAAEQLIVANFVERAD